MLVSIPLGIASGFVGSFFVTTLLKARTIEAQWKVIPIWMKPALGGLTMGIVGVSAYAFTGYFGDAQTGVFSIGYVSLDAAFEGRLILIVLVALFIFKFIAVIISYATGGSGGLFSPTLFLGGMLGGIFGVGLLYLHQHLHWFGGLPRNEDVVGACVLLGMGAMFRFHRALPDHFTGHHLRDDAQLLLYPAADRR